MNLDDKDIDKLFREGLGDMNLQYDAEGWSAMQNKLKASKKKKGWLGLFALALFLGAGTFLYFSFEDYLWSEPNLSAQQDLKNDSLNNEISSLINNRANSQPSNALKENKAQDINDRSEIISIPNDNITSSNKSVSNSLSFNEVVKQKSAVNNTTNKTKPNLFSSNKSFGGSQTVKSIPKTANSDENNPNSNGTKTIQNKTQTYTDNQSSSEFNQTTNSILSNNPYETFGELNSKNNTANLSLKPFKNTSIDKTRLNNAIHTDSVMLNFGKDTTINNRAWSIEIYPNLSSNTNYKFGKLSTDDQLGYKYGFEYLNHYNIGLGINYHFLLKKKIEFSSGLLFRQYGFKENKYDESLIYSSDYKYNYLDLSVSFSYNVIEFKKLVPFASVKTDFNLLLNSINKIYISSRDETLNYPFEASSSLSINYTGGICYNLNHKWSSVLALNFSHSIMPVSIINKEQIHSKNWGLRIGIRKNIFKTIKTPPSFK